MTSQIKAVPNWWFSQGVTNFEEELARVICYLNSNDESVVGLRRRQSGQNQVLAQDLIGRKFKSPVGLAAGFDRYGELTGALSKLGFGWGESGIVTPRFQMGNDFPCVFLDAELGHIVDRSGTHSHGSKVMFQRGCTLSDNYVGGVNVGYNASTPSEDVVDDLVTVFKDLFSAASFFSVCLAPPLTNDHDRFLISLERIEEIGRRLENIALDSGLMKRPFVVRVSSCFSDSQLSQICDVCKSANVDMINVGGPAIQKHGVIGEVTSTEFGGLCGEPIYPSMLSALKTVRSRWKGPLSANGGINSVERAWEALRYANLIQIYSAFVFQGPSFVHELNEGIARRLTRGGYQSISERQLAA